MPRTLIYCMRDAEIEYHKESQDVHSRKKKFMLDRKKTKDARAELQKQGSGG